MFRTPAKSSASQQSATPPKPVRATVTKSQTNVRRSIGEWEAGRVLFPEEALTASHCTADVAVVELPAQSALPVVPKTKPLSARAGRVQEARACVTKAKTALNASRNLKTDIKADVTQAIDRLYQLVKEDESQGPAAPPLQTPIGMSEEGVEGALKKGESGRDSGRVEVTQLLSSLAEHSRLMRESNERAKELQTALQVKKETLEAITYASVAASAKGRKRALPAALHSVVVASRDVMETGEEVLGRIRKAVNAKAGDVQVERVRKGKDRKVVISCRSEEIRNTLRSKIEEADQQLEVQVVQNLDPLVIFRDVLSSHSNEDVLQFLKMQNKKLFLDLPAGDDRIEIKFRRRARNDLICHVVARVSPTLWNRLLGASEVYLDLQHIRVEDQSPLVQCSMCLGYGHSRRLCVETTEKCGHCGGPHLRKDCAEKLANAAPTCCNCVTAKLDMTGHNAFSSDCPVRRRWDALARAKVAYC